MTLAQSVAQLEGKLDEAVTLLSASRSLLDAKVQAAAASAATASAAASVAATGVTGPQGPAGPTSIVPGPAGAAGAPGVFGPLQHQTLAYAATTQWPAQLNTVAQLLLTGNTTLAAPTGLENGKYYLIVDRDATAGRTLAWPAGFLWKDGTPPTQSTAGGTRDIYEFLCLGGVMQGTQYSKGVSLAGVPVVLAAPTGVATSAATASSMVIGWTAVVGATGYNVYRAGVKISATPVTGTSFGDTGLTASTAYSWTVTALNAAGESVASAAAAGTTTALALPSAPTGLATTSPSTTTMTLAWFAAAGADAGYNVYRGTTKINPGPVTALSFTDTGLAASTSYSWTVKAVNAAGEGPASNTATAVTRAAASAGGLVAAPAKVLGAYFTTWDYSRQIQNISENWNVLHLFNAQPAGATNAAGNRDGVGNGSFFIADLGAAHISAAGVQALRNRGVKVLLTCGGAGAGFNFTTSAQVTNFVASFQSMATALGGVDGIDFNTFESYVRNLPSNQTSGNPAFLVSIAQQLKAIYGSNFMVTMAPSADAWGVNAFSPLDALIATALVNANCLTYAIPQNYDWSGLKAPGVVTRFVSAWASGIGADKVVAGLSAEYDFANSLTLAECQREYRTLKAACPTLRGANAWTAQLDDGGGRVWSGAMKTEVGAVAAVAAPADDSAITAALAYSGGQNGAWIDVAPAYLKKNATDLVTASGDAVWTLTDRSSNTNHLQRTASNTGTYTAAGAYKHVGMATQFQSATGGGSGDTGSSGFFACIAVKPTTDYPLIWSDSTSGFNNGRTILYEAYTGAITLIVGTGATNVQISVTGLAPLNVAPNVPFVIEARQDATHIYLKVNGGTEVSSTCPACSPGSANFALNGSFVTPPWFSSGDYFYSFHALNPLTAPLRDGVAALVTSRIG